MSLLHRHRKESADVYSDIDHSKLILRDYLAIDRTILANQNTFLAYIRTALTLFAAGLTFIKFFDSRVLEYIGWAFIPIGVITFVVGLIRYNRLRATLSKAKTD